jgi:hypothetical protein
MTTDPTLASRRIALALQASLLGEITCNVFAVTFGRFGERVEVVFYMYDDPTHEELDDLGSAMAEALSFLADKFDTIDAYFVPLTQRRPVKLDEWVFMRKDYAVIEQIEPYQSERVDPQFAFEQFSECKWLERE